MTTAVEYVFELPTTIIYEFCNLLDSSFWEEVGKFVRKIDFKIETFLIVRKCFGFESVFHKLVDIL